MNLKRIQQRHCSHDSGFTRVELMAVLLVLTLLGALALPILANGKSGSQRAVCVNNLSRFPQPVELDLSEHRDYTPLELTGGVKFPSIGELPYLLTLPGHGFYWFQLVEAGDDSEMS